MKQHKNIKRVKGRKARLTYMSKSVNHFSAQNDPYVPSYSSELKFIDTNVSAVVSAGGTWTRINLPTQGNTASNRVADRARILCLEHIGQFNVSALDVLRLIIIQTKGINLIPPTTNDLLVSPYPVVPYVYNAREIYDVISDDVITMSPNGDTEIVAFKRSIKCKFSEMKFISGTSNVYSGQLYVLAISIGGTMQQNNTYRLWFEDGN